MSNLPESWVEIEIADIAEVIGGGTPKASNPENFEEPGNGIAWLTPADLSGYTEKYIGHGKRDISEKGHQSSSAKLMPKNTVLFTSRAPIGYVAIAANEISTNQGFKSFMFGRGVDPGYAYYYLRSIKGLAQSLGTGTTFKELSGSAIKKLPFILAPENEQIRIANKLDELLAQVDTIKARVDAIPSILSRFRHSVIAAAVSGRLTEEWREGASPERVCFETIAARHAEYFEISGKQHKAPAAPREDDFVFDLPSSWQWFRAEQLCDLITKGTTPKKEKMTSTGDVPYVKVYNLTFDGTLDFTIDPTFIDIHTHNKALARSKVFPGDVLMNIVGPPLGKVSIVPDSYAEWNINQAIAIFRPICGVTNEYLSLCLQNDALLEVMKRRAKATAGQFNLTLEICRDFLVPVPSIDEQLEIISRVRRIFEYMNIVMRHSKEAEQRVNDLTQSIRAKAFRGELVPQDPDDEPASVLLERIQGERRGISAS